MSTLNQFVGSGRIKSVQRSVTTVGQGATGSLFIAVPISPVNTSKTFVMIRGTEPAVPVFSGNVVYGRAALTSSTQVTVTQGNSAVSASVIVYWTVVEYY